MKKFFKGIVFIFALVVFMFTTIFVYKEHFENKSASNETDEYLVAGPNAKDIFQRLNNKTNKKGNNTDAQYQRLFNDVLARVKIGYVEDVDNKKLIEAAINGMLTSLDPHSGYLSSEDFREMTVQTKGEFGGLGIEITMDNSLVKVISPIEGTPAFKAGIKSGDYISHIDGKSVIGMSLIESVKLMRGRVGTKVKITVLRIGESEPMEFKIKRGNIKIKAVRGHKENNIAYIKLNTFSEQTYRGMIKEFNKIENQIGKKNLKGFILDLRGNPGGLLDQSIMIADVFLDAGKTIVSVKGRGGKEINVYKDKRDEDLIPNIPMVVLINAGSASASEIVAGALKDNGRAVVMGTKSFGKGSVQSVIPISMGGAIRMTIARYYTPSGISIQAEGVEPDIVVQAAKIEAIENKWVQKEGELKGHLAKEKAKIKAKAIQLNTNNEDLYNKDYQLARAVDLLLGINFYKSTENDSNAAK